MKVLNYLLAKSAKTGKYSIFLTNTPPPSSPIRNYSAQVNVPVLEAAAAARDPQKLVHCAPKFVPISSTPSSIYCSGRLLHTIQLGHIYDDSKTFVDQPLRYLPAVVEDNFTKFMIAYEDKPDKSALIQFVNDNFLPHGNELEEWIPTDYHDNPKFLRHIECAKYRAWAQSVHGIWKTLGRKISTDVRDNPEKHSLIYVSNPFIIPGGRFREFYYWDSYWIQKGLLVSEMHETVKGMLKNFMEMVDRFGYVPNGGRVYYSRSQPPLLIPMVQNYLEATDDTEFLKESLPTLEKEFQFWMKNRMVDVIVDGVTYSLARYNATSTLPRPESYREDFHLASGMQTDEDRHELYANLHSGAESGWDFSSRWFARSGNPETLVNIKTRHIIPVDLNGFLYLNANLLAHFYAQVGQPEKAGKYEEIAKTLKKAINAVLWNEELGSWFDFCLTGQAVRKDFYPTTIVPLWAGMCKPGGKRHRRVLDYLKSCKIFEFPGGVPTSLDTGEQWNFPNAWSPLQSLLVDGLEATGHPESQALALHLAQKWLASNYKGYYESDAMYEKYDATVPGISGGGGEYVAQSGFGWTNGVALDLLARYGSRLRDSASG